MVRIRWGHYNVLSRGLSFQGGDICQESVSGQAIEKMGNEICRENLPSQFSFEWTQLTYQESYRW